MRGMDYVTAYEKRTPGSKALFQRALEVMPGGVSHRVRYIRPHPTFIRRAEGSKIWDVDGNEYIDLWMGHFALIMGHNAGVIREALNEVAELGTHWGIVHEHEIRFAELVCETVPCAEKVVFGVSGTEATMYAVRLARARTGKRMILKMEGGWHGANSDLLWAVRRPFEVPESAGVLPEFGKFVRSVPFNDLEGTARIIREVKADLAGIIVEPVIGAGGMLPADKSYLEMLREETTRSAAVLIFDEIITGFRLALGGAQAFYGIEPDLTTLGKVAGGGVHLGVVAGKGEILSLCAPNMVRKKGEGVVMGGGTFSCSPLSMVLGCRILEHLKRNEKKIYPKIDALGLRLREGMTTVFRKRGIPAQATGVGSLCGLCFPMEPRTPPIRSAGQMQELTDVEKLDGEFRVRALNHGVYVVHGGGAISFAHTEEDIDRIIAATDEVAREMA